MNNMTDSKWLYVPLTIQRLWDCGPYFPLRMNLDNRYFQISNICHECERSIPNSDTLEGKNRRAAKLVECSLFGGF
jgi:hypothetical protein